MTSALLPYHADHTMDHDIQVVHWQSIDHQESYEHGLDNSKQGVVIR